MDRQMNEKPIYRDERTGVWMMNQDRHCSAARDLACRAMDALRMNSADDFRTRDQIIEAISPQLKKMLDSLTADNAAKDAEIARLRNELTALREAAEVAKKRVAISRDLLAGNLNKGASRDDVADLYSRWANIEKQLSAALSPAADE